MFYDRQIKYLDYLENQERRKGAGFVKIEVRDKALNLTVQVSGLGPVDTFEGDVLLLDGQREQKLGSIRLEKGKGSFWAKDLDKSSIGKTGISYDSLAGIRIPLGGTREIYCAFAGREREKASKEPGETEASGKPETSGGAEIKKEPGKPEESLAAAERILPEPEKALPENLQPAQKQPQVCISEPEPANAPPENSRSLTEAVQASAKKGEMEKDYMRLAENKWQQLSAVYPHIRPFGDERDYLSIGPADFVVLPEKYYRMANNSFLLHGYYNYEHLILTRVERRGRILYYVGVPGNFYDREKQVAVMFGFESFECKEEPARQGEFGYYLMRVEL